MASPEGVTPVYNNVVISVYGGQGGFGIRSAPGFTNSAVGTVYKIGSNVYNVVVGNKVGFKNECYFATDLGETFASVDKTSILITYTAPP